MYAKQSEKDTITLCLFVDDIIIAGTSIKAIDDVKSVLEKEFKMTENGCARQVLGMRVMKNAEKIQSDLEAYIQR